MATTSRAKDYSGGKEKRGTSPSSSLTSHSERNKEKSTERNIPNYLKPTISSSHEVPLKPLKKNSNEDQQKYLRRRSFDRPPSASPRVQKALISPGRPRERTAVPGVLPREKKITGRSTSFPTKTSSSQKAVSDTRTSKTPKASKPQPLASRGIKKSASTSSSPLNKKESNIASPSPSPSPSMIASNSSDVATEVVEDDTKQLQLQEEKESLVHEVEEVIKFENEVEEPNSDHLQKSQKEEHINAVVRETRRVLNGTGEAEKNIKPCDHDISTVTNDERSPQLPAQQNIGETEDKSKEINIVTVLEVKENVDECGDSNNPEETVIEEAKAEVEEKEEQQKATDQELACNEDNISDEKDVERNDQQCGEEESEGIDKEIIKEGVQEVEGDGDQKAMLEDEAAAAANVASKGQDQGQGKKESPSAAYNDVIEETASKLLEKRKNKVRALVGAFETVIDYETSASK